MIEFGGEASLVDAIESVDVPPHVATEAEPNRSDSPPTSARTLHVNPALCNPNAVTWERAPHVLTSHENGLYSPKFFSGQAPSNP